MFTGIVEEVGTVVRRKKTGRSILFSILGPKTSRGTRKSDSLAVDGVCLTVLRKKGSVMSVQVVEETLSKTTLGALGTGARVNLERPLRADGRFGGHVVLGHVDGIGRIRRIVKRKNSWAFSITIPKRFRKFLIPVGSIAVNGVSLTIARLGPGEFSVSIIPHTWNVTTFKMLRTGDTVNIEFDVLGKYVSNLLKSLRA